jgi:signal transduction histidine kinase
LPIDAHVRAVAAGADVDWRASLTGSELRGLAEEQAALRRVATLVARGTAHEEVFAAVIEEVVRLLGADLAIMGRYGSDATLTSVARSGGQDDHLPVGSRTTLGGRNLGTIVFETGRPARIDDYVDTSSGSLGGAVNEAGIRSSVATPITVEGRLWGVIAAGSTAQEPLPAETEARLADFTELVATAIANAESRGELARLAVEQAALRRVATLVARGTSPEEVFAAVIDEVVQLLPVDYAGMARYDADAMVTAVATRGTTHIPIGSSLALGGKNTATLVFETGFPARIDGYVDASGSMGENARERGVRSSVAAPIVVEGRLWGLIGAGSIGERPLPSDTEGRLADFTELVATAIANAESRGELARLAEEQAALRRVATLVARGAPQQEVFAAVIDEVGRLLPVFNASMVRYEPDGTVTAVGAWGKAEVSFAVGSRWSAGGNNLITAVLETRGPARMDKYADASGPIAAATHEMGVRSAVASPILIEGRLWGVIVAGSNLEQPLPADTESRLASFTELVATAVANAESRAEVTASRARIVMAADESRRRIERDLHDGAQQRLVHAVIALKLALHALSNGEVNANAEELVAEALRHAEQANVELRELAHGILPASLTRGGLRAGIDGLVSRVSLPVSIDVSLERLSAAVEATAYFIVSEALTNVVKHARATGARVTARVEGGELRVEIRDDGVGGAQARHSTGLEGLEDRVAALGGRLELDSPRGGGTRVCAVLPVVDKS